MKSLKSKNISDFYNLFKPQLTPKKMLELGVFGGSYFGVNIKEYPKSWFKRAKISKKFNVDLNFFKVKSGLSRKEWQEKGWIFKQDPLDGSNDTVDFQMEGAFSNIDEIQIKRWKNFTRHVIAIKKTVNP